MAVFRKKNCIEESATKFLHVKIVSDKVVRHSLPIYSCKSSCCGRPLLPENLSERDPPFSKMPISN